MGEEEDTASGFHSRRALPRNTLNTMDQYSSTERISASINGSGGPLHRAPTIVASRSAYSNSGIRTSIEFGKHSHRKTLRNSEFPDHSYSETSPRGGCAFEVNSVRTGVGDIISSQRERQLNLDENVCDVPTATYMSMWAQYSLRRTTVQRCDNSCSEEHNENTL